MGVGSKWMLEYHSCHSFHKLLSDCSFIASLIIWFTFPLGRQLMTLWLVILIHEELGNRELKKLFTVSFPSSVGWLASSSWTKGKHYSNGESSLFFILYSSFYWIIHLSFHTLFSEFCFIFLEHPVWSPLPLEGNVFPNLRWRLVIFFEVICPLHSLLLFIFYFFVTFFLIMLVSYWLEASFRCLAVLSLHISRL